MEEVIEAAVLAGCQEGGRGIEGEGLREGEMRERVKQAERQHIKKQLDLTECIMGGFTVERLTLAGIMLSQCPSQTLSQDQR